MGGNGSLDDYCGSPFWNSTRTWYTDNPDFTICFEKTVLVWIPCTFMLLSAPIESYCVRKSKDKDIPWNWLNTSKLATTMCLFALTIAKLTYAAVSRYSGMDVDSVDISTPLFLAAVFLCVATLQLLGRKNGRRSSGVITLFWFLLLVCAIPQYRTELDYQHDEKYERYKQVLFISYMIHVPLVAVMFILHCFSEPEPRHIHYQPSGRKSPELGASYVSKIFFCWYDSFAWKGYRNELEFQDIWPLKSEDTARENGSTLLKHWDRHVRRLRAQCRADTIGLNDGALRSGHPKASILPALGKAFGLTFFTGGVLKLLASALTFVNPQLLKLLIAFVKSDAEPLWRGLLYATGMFVTAMLQTLFSAHYQQEMYLLGNRVRTALIAVIYQKALRLSNTARKDTTVGEISNLMSVDAERLNAVACYLHLIWSAPLQILLSMYFLWGVLGPSALAGLVVMVVSLPANSVIANKMENLQTEEMTLKDERAKVVNEMLNGIKAIKLYAWELPFVQKITDIRNKEIGVLLKGAYLSGMDSFLWECTPFMVSLVSFATYVLVDKNNVLDTEKAFVALALFNILRQPLSTIAMLVSSIIQAAVSTKRINKFMNLEDLDPSNVLHDFDVEFAIKIEDGTFAWSRDEPPNLTDINLEIKRGSLVAVVGHVGSGKSSLVKAILGEMDKINGQVNSKGTTAYVPEQAWIQNASLKANVLFARSMDADRYAAVVEGCALTSDFAILPGGDETEIGEKGINLSGGQKQRVSLARAVYSDADTYLLDDPLSAVDSHVGKHIFENVIGPKGLLKDKTRIFVTHGVALLPEVDYIIVMKDGQVHGTGTYDELLISNDLFSSFINLQGVSSHNDVTTVDALDEFGEVRLSEALSDTQHTTDRTSTGLSSRRGSRSSNILRRQASNERNLPSSPAVKPVKTNLIDDEAMASGSVKWHVYAAYIQSIGVVCTVATIATNLLYQGFSIGSNTWLSVWSSDNTTTYLLTASEYPGKLYMYLGVYGALGLGQAVGMVLGSTVPLIGCVRAGRIMHRTLLDGVVHAPLRFFDTTPVGRLLARFGKDISVLDDELPHCIMGTLVILFEVLASLFIIGYTTPKYVAVIFPIAVLYGFLQRFYVRTARQVKRLLSVSRSPVFSHFSESIIGATSIRAYGVTDRFINEAQVKFDLNQACYYTSLVADRWLVLRLELLGNLLVLFAALFAVLGRASNIAPGLVGLSVSYALQITPFLNWLMRLAAEVETDIVAVERIKEYSDTPKEAPWENDHLLDPAWPQKGAISFIEYQLRYREGLDLVLKDTTFTVKGGEKVGIVGRTGAGKSSLTLSLFRIIEGAGGSITIDGIDISKLGLHALRSRLTIIPQDPVLFTGSLRFNLDPFDQHTDLEVWKALDYSYLKTHVEGLANGLHHNVTEGGENFSIGQRQLICLTRALLRKTKILVLDEATASVDLETDDLIQRTIRTEFKECTILTIAHRLNTIMDSDRVLVLDQGRVTEFDTPASLLQNPNSTFYSMSRDAGLILCSLE